MRTSAQLWYAFLVLTSLIHFSTCGPPYEEEADFPYEEEADFPYEEEVDIPYEEEELLLKNEITNSLEDLDMVDGVDLSIERNEEEENEMMENESNSMDVQTRCDDERDIDCKIQRAQENLEEFFDKGFELAEEGLQRENEAIRARIRRGNIESKSTLMQYRVKKATARAKKISSCRGTAMLEISVLVAKSLNLTAKEIPEALKRMELPHNLCSRTTSACTREEADELRQTPTCTKTTSSSTKEYRPASGQCNNKKNPTWGGANIFFRRFAPSAYDNGVDTARVNGVNGSPLPNAREVSVAIINSLNPPPSGLMTQLVKQWGQFLDHDMTLTPESVASDHDGDGEPDHLPCCDDGVFRRSEVSNSGCNPITTTDSFYTSKNVQCLRFVRSLQGDTGCRLRPREQFNLISGFIDASNVYGPTVKRMSALRTGINGTLRTSATTEGGICSTKCENPFLPPSTSGKSTDIFFAGDIRVNEQPALTAIHTIWMRYHNIITGYLQEAKPAWKDERLFQEARRIIGALMQHITFNEFLPMVLSPTTMSDYDLTPKLRGTYYKGYDPTVDPSLTNVFAAAAFRFGHSLISNLLQCSTTTLKLCDHFFNNDFLYDDTTYPSHCISGESHMPSEAIDAKFVSTLTGKLFAPSCFGHGNDLMALNVQRGRDHGLPGINVFRVACGLPAYTSFSSFGAAGARLSQIYASVDDVDIFVGALAEIPPNARYLGPTFSCILGSQFQRLKRGDRFYYENNLPEMQFTTGQLEAIHQTKFSTILCETTSVRRYDDKPMYLDGGGSTSCFLHKRYSVGKRIKYYWPSESNENLPSTFSG